MSLSIISNHQPQKKPSNWTPTVDPKTVSSNSAGCFFGVSPCQALDSMFETTSLLPDHALMDVVGALGRNLRLRCFFCVAA